VVGIQLYFEGIFGVNIFLFHYWWKIPGKTQPCHPRFQIWMNFFMDNPPDLKSLFPEFFLVVFILLVSPEKNNEF
jgi:hypothetical protein